MTTDTKGLKIAANSFFQQMRTYGYSSKQIIQTVNELLELVTHMVQHQNQRGDSETWPQEQESQARP